MWQSVTLAGILIVLAWLPAFGQDAVGDFTGTITLRSGQTLQGTIKLAEFGVVYGSSIGTLQPEYGAIELDVNGEKIATPGRDIWAVQAEWKNEGSAEAADWVIAEMIVTKKDGSQVIGKPVWKLHCSTSSVVGENGETRRVSAIPLTQKDFSADNFIQQVVIGDKQPPAAPITSVPAEGAAAPAEGAAAPAEGAAAPAEGAAAPAEGAAAPAEGAAAPAEGAAAPAEGAAAPAEGAEAPAEGAEAPAEGAAAPAEGAEAPAEGAAAPAEGAAAPAEGAEAPAEGAEAPAEGAEAPAEGAEAPAEGAAAPAEGAEAPAEGAAAPVVAPIAPVPVDCMLEFANLTNVAEQDRVKATIVEVAVDGRVTVVPCDAPGSIGMAFTLADVTALPALVESIKYRLTDDGGKALVFEESGRMVTSKFRTAAITGTVSVSVSFCIAPGADLFYSAAPGEETQVAAGKIDRDGNVTLQVAIARGQEFIYARTVLGEIEKCIKIDIFTGESVEISRAQYEEHS